MLPSLVKTKDPTCVTKPSGGSPPQTTRATWWWMNPQDGDNCARRCRREVYYGVIGCLMLVYSRKLFVVCGKSVCGCGVVCGVVFR
jgi:hypothetical protein